MYNQVLLIVLAIHYFFAIIYSLFIYFNKTRLRKEFIIPLLFLPVFGIATALMIELINSKKKQEDQALALYKLFLDDDVYWEGIEGGKEDENIVPLEEAMLLNDDKVRRQIMLNILYDDPQKYLDVLIIACKNEDIETAHYASTTISKIQREFQLEIQKLSVAIENDQNNDLLLDAYINTLENYIESGVLEDYLLHRQRLIYSQALDQKLKKNNKDQATIIKKIHNSLQLKDPVTAYETSNLLRINWPLEEQTWIETVRVCVESRDKNNLNETIAEMNKTKIDWTKQGRELVSPWISGVVNEK